MKKFHTYLFRPFYIHKLIREEGMMMSKDCYGIINDLFKQIIKNACNKARLRKRKTVRSEDFHDE